MNEPIAFTQEQVAALLLSNAAFVLRYVGFRANPHLPDAAARLVSVVKSPCSRDTEVRSAMVEFASGCLDFFKWLEGLSNDVSSWAELTALGHDKAESER